MRELTWRQSNQSEKAEIVKCCYRWQILQHSGNRKAKRSFTVSVKTAKETNGKVTLKDTTGMVRLPGAAR